MVRVWRRVVCAAVEVRIGGANHVNGLMLDVLETRGWRRGGVRDAVPIALVVSARIVHHRVVFGGEVGGVYLWLVVVVVVAYALDYIGRVVGGAAEAARRRRGAAQQSLRGCRRVR